MSIYKKIILFIIIIFITFCKKKEVEHSHLVKYDSKELVGSWKIIPSGGEKIFFEAGSKAKIIEKNGNQIQVYLRSDGDGLRILESEEAYIPIGYFLFHEKKENLWAGVYKKHLVRLEREQIPKKSILE
jgi:hypothetical protein